MTEHAEHRGPAYKDYVMVFVSLAVLTAATVAISYTGLGHGAREVLAFAIAVVKTVLVASIFMHLRFETRTIVIFAVSPLILAIIFILAISPEVGIAQ
jgi:caa(3)-type oxidase subunit IV